MEEIRAPLNVVRRLLGDNRTASAASIPQHFCAALDGKWDQVKPLPPAFRACPRGLQAALDA
jgi:hypothetical protein